MADNPKAPQDDEPQGAPEWMVTFSDCMTLLLTFFVLLLSFSSFDDKVHRQLKETMFMDLPSVYRQVKRERDAVKQAEQIIPTRELEKGSEKETLKAGPSGNLQDKSRAEAFRSRKVFLIPSREVFLGRGTALSPKGREMLRRLAEFLEKVPGRIVICESAPDIDSQKKELGLKRCWSVLHRMCRVERFDAKRLSITASTTIPESHELNRDQRWLEIVILDRSIAN